MTFHRIANAPPPPPTPPDVTVRVRDVLTVLDKHIATFSRVAQGYRTMLLLQAIRQELAQLERLGP